MIGNDPIEIIRSDAAPRRVGAVLFDWDGTLSLLREGWSALMTAQMLGVLRDADIGPNDADRVAVVDSIVIGLNGRPTIAQMQALVAHIAAQGGQRAAPEVFLAEYQKRLLDIIGDRYAAIESGAVDSRAWAVPGAHDFLRYLRSRGCPIVVLSGTTRHHVVREMRLLELDTWIDELHAPPENAADFSKRQVIEQLLTLRQLRGSELLAFGDGVVETEDVHRLGGTAIAVASSEPPQRGVNPIKRDRLICAGADAVIADYSAFPQWIDRFVARE